jgi:outer membrane protein OmpA-like peptidoglycan-associated protein
MKKLTTLLLLLCCIKGFSQDADNYKRWNFSIGINIVDNRGTGELFGGLTQVDQSAFGTLPLTLALEKRFDKLFGIEAVATINSWDARTGVIDGVLLPSSEGYYSLDVNGKLYVNELFKFSEEFKWLEIYANVGLGRFTINKGTFNFNYGGGASIWLSDRLGLDFRTMIKNSFNDSERFETGHFVYSMGLIFNLSAKKKKKKKVVKEKKVSYTDTDSDSVPDDRDKCPSVPGLPGNGGCPQVDSDGDGVVDPANRGCPAPPKEEPKVVEKKTEPKEDLVSVAKRIKFESGNYNFTQDTYPYLIDLAKILIQEPTNVRFKIIGHTDSAGEYEANRTLSYRRASAVRNYLVDSGIAKNRIDIEGLGESDPVDSNLTAEGRANNRRVDIIIIK